MCCGAIRTGCLLAFRQDGDAIVVCGDGLAPDNRAGVHATATQVLGLDHDLSGFYAFAESDAALWSVVAPLVGLPLFTTETVFEALVTLIIEQHISWKGAMRAQRTLMQLFHEGADVGPSRVYDFPTPKQLAEATAAQLKALKITDRRSELLIEIALREMSGELDLESIRRLPARDAYAKLMSIKGVGHWTASNTIGRATARHKWLTENDVALQSAVNHYFYGGLGVKSAARVADTLGGYGEYAGLAGHFVLLRWVLEHYPPVSK